MATNDIILLNSVLQQKKSQLVEKLSDSDYFEIFTFEQLLKNYDLSYDELLTGKVGGADDGGIDGMFTFVNEELLDEDTEIDAIKKSPFLEVYLIQAKRSPSFSESAVDRVIATVQDIFNLEKDILTLSKSYNTELTEKVALFRQAYIKLAARHPELKVYYIYASKGDLSEIHPKVRGRAATLAETMSRYFPGASAEVQFAGARELLDASRVEKSYTLQLHFLESYISRGEDNYAVLSSLNDYFRFVTDEGHNLRRYIFESNVRDYQGDVEVNRDIAQTLESNDTLDFWWLNNGITILASKASIVGKTITLDDVQVVNGLQTTTAIFNHLKTKPPEHKEDRERAILIRIIVTTDAEARDRIIKATNFQTRIPDASLRATDRIQRDIEDYFLRHDWFYDRRKNYYKNIGKPADRIISIPYLAQAVMAILLREPDNSRARPSSLIKRSADYARVFSPAIPLSVYLFCAKTMKKIDTFIRSYLPDTPWHIKSNFRFHLAMLLTTKLIGRTDYEPKDLQATLDSELKESTLTACVTELLQVMKLYANREGYSPSPPLDTIVKSRDFVVYLLANTNPGFLLVTDFTERTHPISTKGPT